MSTFTEIQKITQSSNPLNTCIAGALLGQIGSLRGLYWRILLGLLPTPCVRVASADDLLEEWEACMEMRRKDYSKRLSALRGTQDSNAQNVAKKEVRFGDSDDSDHDDAIHDNPLASGGTGNYAKSFERKKLEETIEKDVTRLWSDDPFFEQEFVLKAIRAVLLLYCEEESELAYRQGMHELVAFIVYTLHADADACQSLAVECAADGAVKEALDYICSSSYIIEDTYWIFRLMMCDEGMHCSSWYYTQEHSPRDTNPAEQTEMTFVASLIQGSILHTADPQLATHLNKTLDIQPTAYAIRWLRLWFLREFTFNHSSRIWDLAFAEYAYKRMIKKFVGEYNISQSLLPHVAASMLVFVRGDLLESDFSYALRRLMRYPPIEDIQGIITTAVARRYGDQDIGGYFPSLPKRPEPKNDAPVKTHEKRGAEQTVELERRNERLGQILSSVVTSMESKWFPDAKGPVEKTEQEINESYLLAIAELKRVRDILLKVIDE